ncbi:MAG TPA: helix-turn-helix domain-containing protein [bacterium]|nr:helix-turn-helix domain-containing protein [bacterium]
MRMERNVTDDDRLLRERDAASFIGVSRRTLQGWRLTGRGPQYHKISERCIRYSRELLEDWLASTVRNSTSDQ